MHRLQLSKRSSTNITYQRTFTKRIPALHDSSYYDRLSNLGSKFANTWTQAVHHRFIYLFSQLYGSTTVVMATHGLHWKWQSLTLCQRHPSKPIEKIFGTIDYVIDMNNLAKFGFGKILGTEVHIPNISACINSINMNKFIHDIHTSILISHPPNNLPDLVDCYNKTLSDLLNKHAPLKSKLFRPKPSNPWFSPTLAKLKSTRRRLEKIWSSSHSLLDLKLLRSATNHYHAAIIKAKKLYNSSLISSNLHNPRKLWHTINHLLHKIAAPSLPSSDSLSSFTIFCNIFFR